MSLHASRVHSSCETLGALLISIRIASCSGLQERTHIRGGQHERGLADVGHKA